MNKELFIELYLKLDEDTRSLLDEVLTGRLPLSSLRDLLKDNFDTFSTPDNCL